MSSVTGIAVIGDYVTPASDPLRVTALRNLIPNPDAAAGTGPVGGGGQGTANSYLDEMSPSCAAQLRVELASLIANVT